jgi:hypothetical protein
MKPTKLIKEPTAWPKAVVRLVGVWPDFPTAEEIRSGLGKDAPREAL